MNFNASSTKKSKKTEKNKSLKARGIGVNTVIGAHGVLAAVIVEIKDSNFEKVERFDMVAIPGCKWKLSVITIPSRRR